MSTTSKRVSDIARETAEYTRLLEQAEKSFKRDPGMEDKLAPGQFLNM